MLNRWAANVRSCLYSSATGLNQRTSLLVDNVADIGRIGQDDFVVRLARGDHGQAVFVLFDKYVEQNRTVIVDHFGNGDVQRGGRVTLDALGAIGLGQLDEIG